MYREVIVEGVDVLEEFAFGNAFGVVFDFAKDIGLYMSVMSLQCRALNKSYLFAGLQFHAHIGT